VDDKYEWETGEIEERNSEERLVVGKQVKSEGKERID
jgi:hypothetical protein